VAGVVRSEDPQQRNVAFTHLPFVQEAVERGGTGGMVTQFAVTVDDPSRLEEIASAIDAEFENDREPTSTSPEKAFVAQAASDLVELVDFAGWLALAALVSVLALVGNAIVLAVQDRVREHAVLQTLGYRSSLVARMVVLEGAILGLCGGGLGAFLAWAILARGRFSMAMEGLNVEIVATGASVGTGLALSVALGAVASLVPAAQAARRPIVTCLRAE
jgi:putative ABC transport system permease protein